MNRPELVGLVAKAMFKSVHPIYDYDSEDRETKARFRIMARKAIQALTPHLERPEWSDAPTQEMVDAGIRYLIHNAGDGHGDMARGVFKAMACTPLAAPEEE